MNGQAYCPYFILQIAIYTHFQMLGMHAQKRLGKKGKETETEKGKRTVIRKVDLKTARG